PRALEDMDAGRNGARRYRRRNRVFTGRFLSKIKGLYPRHHALTMAPRLPRPRPRRREPPNHNLPLPPVVSRFLRLPLSLGARGPRLDAADAQERPEDGRFIFRGHRPDQLSSPAVFYLPAQLGRGEMVLSLPSEFGVLDPAGRLPQLPASTMDACHPDDPHRPR